MLHRTCKYGFHISAKLLSPALINVKPSLKLHFDDIWAGTYSTFAKVADKCDIYVFGLNNYHQLGKDFIPNYHGSCRTHY